MAYHPRMKYRRFGRTEIRMPVISCGGMRYQYKWQDVAPNALPPDNQANLEATIRRAFELCINPVDTARGYGSSELQRSNILPALPACSFFHPPHGRPPWAGPESRPTRLPPPPIAFWPVPQLARRPGRPTGGPGAFHHQSERQGRDALFAAEETRGLVRAADPD